MHPTLKSFTAALLAGVVMLAAPVAAQDRPDITVALQSMGSATALDSLENTGTAGRKFLNSIFEQLIALDLGDPNLAFKPGLATDWTWIDPTTLELNLRPGVVFHNGDPLTAEDVVFSFSDERFGVLPEQVAAREAGEAQFTHVDGSKGIVPPAAVAAARPSAWPLLERIEAVDEDTVRFVMSQASLDTEARLARLNYAAIVSKRAFQEAESWQAWNAQPIGTGPYKVDRLDQGSTIYMSANDAYWGGEPPIGKLTFQVVPEAASRINGLMSGEYDIVTDVGPDQVPLVEGSPDFDIVGGPLANMRFIALDERNGPLQNPLVRQALSHSIDRETIVSALWSGLTAIPHGFQHPIFGDLFVDDFESPEYDPELARELLAQAGYNGEPITYQVHPDYYPNELTVAQFNLENLRSIGFNIEFAVVENPNDPSDIRMMQDLSNTVHFAHPIALLDNSCPDGSYSLTTSPDTGMWANEEFDALCQVLITSTDKEEVRAAYKRILEIFEKEDPAILMLHQNAILYGKRTEIDWKPSAIFAMDFAPGAFSIEE